MTVVDGHSHLIMEIAHRRNTGETSVFSRHYAEQVRKGGVNVIMMNVGGDISGFTGGSDQTLWGTLWIMDALKAEAQESSDTMAICRSHAEIVTALEEKKVAFVMGVEGGRVLEGKPDLDNLVSLHTLYELGLRHLQPIAMGRNRLGDGDAEPRTGGHLTEFGREIITEADRLGMILDTAHMQEAGFWECLEVAKGPVLNSHSNCKTICDHRRNLTDAQIKAIGQRNGVVCLTSSSSFTSKEPVYGKQASINQWIDHVVHIASIAGIGHVGIGADFDDFPIGPTIWTPAPGFVEGRWYGTDMHMIKDFDNISSFGNIIDGLEKRQFKDDEIAKVMGGNMLRFYEQVLI